MICVHRIFRPFIGLHGHFQRSVRGTLQLCSGIVESDQGTMRLAEREFKPIYCSSSWGCGCGWVGVGVTVGVGGCGCGWVVGGCGCGWREWKYTQPQDSLCLHVIQWNVFSRRKTVSQRVLMSVSKWRKNTIFMKWSDHRPHLFQSLAHRRVNLKQTLRFVNTQKSYKQEKRRQRRLFWTNNYRMYQEENSLMKTTLHLLDRFEVCIDLV